MVKVLIIVFLNILFLTNNFAQDRKELENKRKRIIEQIEKTNAHLKTTKNKKSSTLADLRAIENQLKNRKNLISTLQDEIKTTEVELDQLLKRQDSLKNVSQEIKTNYKHLLRKSYLTKLSNSKWSYLLSSRNINDMFLRWRYLQQFEKYSDSKLSELSYISEQISLDSDELNLEKEARLKLLDETESQKKKLANEQKTKDRIVKNLSKKEKELLAQLNKKKKEREKLNQEIEAIILAELSKHKHEEDAFNTSVSGASKGKIPWPVKQGKVVEKFGEQPHPTIKNIKITNNGIDIVSSNSQKVYAVMDGEVVGVTKIPGYDLMCIIKHGDLYSVYSKMTSAKIKKADKVTQGQEIGITRMNTNKSELHFELWKGKTKVDPEKWLVRK